MAMKNSNNLKYAPDYAVIPGKTLQDTIDALGIDQKELAERTGLTTKTLNLIIKGKAALTQQTAMLLERVTNVPARIWNNLEANYREQLARLEARDQLEKHIAWLREVPTKELISRGFVKTTSDKIQLLEQTLSFFRVASVDAWHEGWGKGQFAFRKSWQASSIDGKLATWLQIAELNAEQASVIKFNKAKFTSAVDAIRSMTNETPSVFVPAMTEACRNAGVALCLVPEIPGGKISGAAKWLTASKAMLAINLRGKKNDLFWFTFFHEAGHILNDSKMETFVDIGYSHDPREHSANAFARQTLIPSKYDDLLITLRTERQVRDFASEIGIAPGIVVGRLQHEKIIGYGQLNALKQTFAWTE